MAVGTKSGKTWFVCCDHLMRIPAPCQPFPLYGHCGEGPRAHLQVHVFNSLTPNSGATHAHLTIFKGWHELAQTLKRWDLGAKDPQKMW